MSAGTGNLDLATLAAAVRELATAMRVMEVRHPHCGAVVWTRQVLDSLPAPLRVPDVDLPAHPEDDLEDGKATIAALTRENRQLREELAAARGEQSALFEVSR